MKQLVRDGKLTAAHARTILAFPAERRETLARRAADEGLSVRALERLAQGVAPKRTRGSNAPAPSADDEYVERLRYRYATQVRVLAQERGGTIELRYADPADCCASSTCCSENTHDDYRAQRTRVVLAVATRRRIAHVAG